MPFGSTSRGAHPIAPGDAAQAGQRAAGSTDSCVTDESNDGTEDDRVDRPASPDHQDAVVTVLQRVGHKTLLSRSEASCSIL
jgi:hypothetical protein